MWRNNFGQTFLWFKDIALEGRGERERKRRRVEEINAKEKRAQSRGRLRLRLLSSSSFVSLVDIEKTTVLSRAQLERSINHL